MDYQIIILAAGKGTRMGDQPIPKVLVPLKGKPIIFNILEEIKKLHFSHKPILVVGFLQDKVKAEAGADYLYVEQTEQLGTGHAVAVAKNTVIAENIIVLYGDMPFIRAESLQNLMDAHSVTGDMLSMFTATVKNFDPPFKSLEKYGKIIRAQNGDILKITELKDCVQEEEQIKEVNPGVYCFNTKWLYENISRLNKQNSQGEYYLTDMLEIAVKDGERVNSLPIDPKEVLGINSWEDHGQAENLI
jgi:bifunctional UDP-N-acetylglucosamine pyrophosphorylase / glucosamine-1-phosphate N-acetyltransferase